MTSPNTTIFDDELTSAILYVSTVVRELLIDELYHLETERADDKLGAAGSLHLLRAIDDRLKPVLNVDAESIRELPKELQRQLVSEIEKRQHHNHRTSGDPPGASACTREAALAAVADLLSRAEEPLRGTDADACVPNVTPFREAKDLLRDILKEVFSRELWQLVCRAALSIVETYGGQADIILVLGEKLGKRIVPGQATATTGSELVWLHSQTITGYCIDKRKVFVCNNVAEKASGHFPDYFKLEPGVRHYKSLLIVPVLVEGEVRALLRLLSTDENCFLDRHTRAMQDIAFVASYALNLLDARQRRQGISEGLTFFAEGQAVSGTASFEELLRGAVRVLGADSAVFWPVANTGEGVHPFGRGLLVNPLEEARGQYCEAADEHYGVRAEGTTHYVLERSRDAGGDLFFCLHALPERGRPPAPDCPEYVLQAFAVAPLPWMQDSKRTSDGFFRQDSNPLDPFPGSTVDVRPSKRHVHTRNHSQIGFAVKEPGGLRARGIVWIFFSDLHYLGWWERLYICGLMNYLGQSLTASNLKLAIRSFRHMIPNVTFNACAKLEKALSHGAELEAQAWEGLSTPDGPQIAMESAYDVLYMAYTKAGEVKALLEGSGMPATVNAPRLGEILRRSWAIATNLGARSSGFRRLRDTHNGETSGHFTVIYGEGVESDSAVSSVLYTASVNILGNAIKHGDRPYVTWCIRKNSTLTVLFGNGGPPPDAGLLMGSEAAQYTQDDRERGVGLALVRRILPPNGRIQLLGQEHLAGCYPNAPEAIKKCKTIFEVQLPLSEDMGNGYGDHCV